MEYYNFVRAHAPNQTYRNNFDDIDWSKGRPKEPIARKVKESQRNKPNEMGLKRLPK